MHPTGEVMSEPQALSSYVGTYRLLLIFASSAETPAFESQQRQFIGAEAVAQDRNFLVGQILLKGACTIGKKKLSRDEVNDLRAHFEIDPQHFCVILLAQDGTEIRRDDAPLKLDVILNEIDTPTTHG